MNSNSLKLINIGTLVSYDSRKGSMASSKNLEIIIEDGKIKEIGRNLNSADDFYDCKNKLITPGFVDCHTHPVFFDDRHNSLSSNQFQTITLSEDNYSRITVEKGIWFGFKGLAKNSLIANLASIEHDPSEVQRCSLDQIEFDWKSLKE